MNTLDLQLAARGYVLSHPPAPHDDEDCMGRTATYWRCTITGPRGIITGTGDTAQQAQNAATAAAKEELTFHDQPDVQKLTAYIDDAQRRGSVYARDLPDILALITKLLLKK